ncbi:MAG TPA: CPBP family intramembrane metalloprotease [Planctomycetes bacterium]|nr:CPBP family intramembrane metalloprotease [Planctomycetota bacterium]
MVELGNEWFTEKTTGGQDVRDSIPRAAREGGSKSWGELPAIALACVLPSLATWVYFVGLASGPPALQRWAYAALKTVQFTFPALWVWAVCRERPSWKSPRFGDLVAGLAFGLAVLAAGLVVYFCWLKPGGFLSAAVAPIYEKVSEFGVGGTWGFLLLAAFYSVIHSFLEEYYFRWFVFGRLSRLRPLGSAITLSGLVFMVHHVIVLGTYFGWLSVGTLLFSLAVAVGGGVWAWMYHRSGSLWWVWLSHLVVDAAIFIVGYDLIRPLLGR